VPFLTARLGSLERFHRTLWVEPAGSILQSRVATAEGARRAFEEAAQVFESLGESRYTATALSNLGEVLHRQKQLEAARRRFEAALEICRRLALPEDTGRPGARRLRSDAAAAAKLAGKGRP